MKRNTNPVGWLVVLAAGGLALALSGVGSCPLTLAAANGPEPAVGFRIGETLEYRINWASLLTAATAELTVHERRPFYGRETWHFRATARTVDATRLLYELDDQFDSYTDTRTLESLRYEMYLREQGEQQETIVRMSAEGHSVQDDGPLVRVPRGTRDPLGFLYYLRSINWAREKAAGSLIYDGRKMYEVRARAASPAPVSVPAGTYSAWPIELRVFERDQELSKVRIRVWLANNVDRTPALIEAEMPFGKLRAELARISTGPKK